MPATPAVTVPDRAISPEAMGPFVRHVRGSTADAAAQLNQPPFLMIAFIVFSTATWLIDRS